MDPKYQAIIDALSNPARKWFDIVVMKVRLEGRMDEWISGGFIAVGVILLLIMWWGFYQERKDADVPWHWIVGLLAAGVLLIASTSFYNAWWAAHYPEAVAIQKLL